MTSTGQIECDDAVLPDTSAFASLDAAIKALAGAPIGPGKLELIHQLIKKIVDSTLDDACIMMRVQQIVSGVGTQLHQDPASVVLHHWSRQPGDVMAAYYHYVGNFAMMQSAFALFNTTNPHCPPGR